MVPESQHESALPAQAWLPHAEELGVPAAVSGELHGFAFAIKDNIGAEGWPAMAACPAWSCKPTQSTVMGQQAAWVCKDVDLLWVPAVPAHVKSGECERPAR